MGGLKQCLFIMRWPYAVLTGRQSAKFNWCFHRNSTHRSFSSSHHHFQPFMYLLCNLRHRYVRQLTEYSCTQTSTRRTCCRPCCLPDTSWPTWLVSTPSPTALIVALWWNHRVRCSLCHVWCDPAWIRILPVIFIHCVVCLCFCMPCAGHLFHDKWGAVLLSFIIDITVVSVIIYTRPLCRGPILGYWGKLEGEAFFAVFLSVWITSAYRAGT